MLHASEVLNLVSSDNPCLPMTLVLLHLNQQLRPKKTKNYLKVFRSESSALVLISPGSKSNSQIIIKLSSLTGPRKGSAMEPTTFGSIFSVESHRTPNHICDRVHISHVYIDIRIWNKQTIGIKRSHVNNTIGIFWSDSTRWDWIWFMSIDNPNCMHLNACIDHAVLVVKNKHDCASAPSVNLTWSNLARC